MARKNEINSKESIKTNEAVTQIIAEFNLSSTELDELREIANIGIGNASMALSSLVDQKVYIGLPKTTVLSVHEVGSVMTKSSESVIGIHSTLQSGLEGSILLVMPSKSALNLVGLLGFANVKLIGKDDKVLLEKFGSILYAHYLSSLAKFFEQKIIYRSPKVISVIGTSIADFLLVSVGEKEKVLLITTAFGVEGRGVDGEISLLFSGSSISKVLGKIKQKMVPNKTR